jgi:hypothetical protein
VVLYHSSIFIPFGDFYTIWWFYTIPQLLYRLVTFIPFGGFIPFLNFYTIWWLLYHLVVLYHSSTFIPFGGFIPFLNFYTILRILYHLWAPQVFQIPLKHPLNNLRGLFVMFICERKRCAVSKPQCLVQLFSCPSRFNVVHKREKLKSHKFTFFWLFAKCDFSFRSLLIRILSSQVKHT